ncbi:uncharacterized protein DS421_18g623750 [Arachis hypogaea]|uniref:GRF-type domain-containing protein n=1 Tax=Arachis hypogaea TaxID=3818 RepID=A0A444Y0P7_ARAHY|nr:uncharacterized protein LOC112770773 [Arachis hypogaea]QHN97007.1 uncharacterized protein DS421_18g623750 [Arachis hypogaea]RYQ95489.1 hypothetical protein Ahy_B08g090802 [Arachis hypogaea]
METGNEGRGGGSWHPSHDNHGSSASMQTRRLKTHHESCFCGLKIVIKKSGSAENPNRLFHACSRYRKGNYCNYFNWVDDDVYEEVGVCSTKKDAGKWRLKVAWRLGILEAKVRAQKLLMIFTLGVVVISVILCCLISTSK